MSTISLNDFINHRIYESGFKFCFKRSFFNLNSSEFDEKKYSQFEKCLGDYLGTATFYSNKLSGKDSNLSLKDTIEGLGKN